MIYRVIGTTKTLGKTAGKDERMEKILTRVGLEKTREALEMSCYPPTRS